MFKDILGKNDVVRFSSPIVYNQTLEQSILSLSNATLSGQDEALCSELLLSLVDNLTTANICTYRKKDNALIKKAKENIYWLIV